MRESRATAGSIAIEASMAMMRVKMTEPPSSMTNLPRAAIATMATASQPGAPHAAPVEAHLDVDQAGVHVTDVGAARRVPGPDRWVRGFGGRTRVVLAVDETAHALILPVGTPAVGHLLDFVSAPPTV